MATNEARFSFQSERSFFILRYEAGHGLLLLRSRMTNDHPRHLDILFKDVRVLEIRCWFDGVRIEETDTGYLTNRASNPSELVEQGNRVYAITGAGWAGFIVGGAVFMHEHERDGEYGAPSALLDS